MPELNQPPHNIKEQIKHLETLIQKRRQESLAHDQEDIDLALGADNVWSNSHNRLVMPLEGSE